MEKSDVFIFSCARLSEPYCLDVFRCCQLWASGLRWESTLRWFQPFPVLSLSLSPFFSTTSTIRARLLTITYLETTRGILQHPSDGVINHHKPNRTSPAQQHHQHYCSSWPFPPEPREQQQRNQQLRQTISSKHRTNQTKEKAKPPACELFGLPQTANKMRPRQAVFGMLQAKPDLRLLRG